MLVLNRARRPFRVELIRAGATYGYNDCLLNDQKEPLVEFYDAAAPTPSEPHGRFARRYRLSELVAQRDHLAFCGIALWDDVPEWRLDGYAMVQVLRWFEWELGRNLDALGEPLDVLMRAPWGSDAARAALAQLRALDPSSAALARYAAGLDSEDAASALGWLTLYCAELESRNRLFPLPSSK